MSRLALVVTHPFALLPDWLAHVGRLRQETPWARQVQLCLAEFIRVTSLISLGSRELELDRELALEL